MHGQSETCPRAQSARIWQVMRGDSHKYPPRSTRGMSDMGFMNIDDDLRHMKDLNDPLYRILSEMRRILADLEQRIEYTEARLDDADI